MAEDKSKNQEKPLEESLNDLDPRVVKQVENAEKSIDKNPSYAIDVCTNILSHHPSCAAVRRVLHEAQRRKFGKGNPVTNIIAKINGIFFAKKADKLVAQGKAAEVLSEGEKLLSVCPINTKVLKAMAEAAKSLGYTATAQELYASIAQSEPSNVKVLAELAKIYIQNKQADDAMNVCKLAMRTAPNDNDIQALFKEATVLKTIDLSTKDGGEIVKDTKNVAEMEQESRLVNDKETLEKNVVRLKEEIAKDVENINLYRELATTLRHLERYGEAVEMVKKARSLPMGAGDTSLEKLEHDLIVSYKEQQLAALEDKLAADPENAELKASVEASKAEIRGYKLESARAMVERYPNDYNYKFVLGNLLFEEGKIDEAIGQFQLSQRNPKVRQQSLLALGKAFIAGKKYDMAVDQLLTAKKESLQMNDARKEIIYTLANAYERMGEEEKAIEQYKDIYKSDIGYRDVSDKINAFYEKKAQQK